MLFYDKAAFLTVSFLYLQNTVTAKMFYLGKTEFKSPTNICFQKIIIYLLTIHDFSKETYCVPITVSRVFQVTP